MSMTTAQAPVQWRVMISSRMVNFELERLAVQRAIESVGMIPWSFENRPQEFAHITSPNALCQYMAEQCDLFLLVLGPTYGFPPDEHEAGSEQSATELEFDWARARRANKIIVFIRQDALEATDPRQRAFIERVSGFMTGYNRAIFHSAEQLNEMIREALGARQRQEILEIPHYLEAVRDKYARLTNPITGVEIDARTTVLLRLRRELEDRAARRSWEEAAGEAPKAFGFLGVLALGRSGPPRAKTQAIAGAEIDNVEYFLDTYQRFVLQGDPGAGKSTLLRRIAFNVAQQGLLAGTGTAGQRIPLYVTAVDLGRVLIQRQGFGLIQAITQILREQGLEGVDVAVESAISNNQAIILIDGLDELAQDEQRAAVLEALRHDVGDNRAVLTTRPAAYQEGSLAGWRTCEVQQLDDELQLSLIGSVLQQLQQLGALTTEIEPMALKNELEDRDDLRVWAGNPLLLTLITTQYALNASLPGERAVIYRLALDRLIDSPYRQSPPRRYRIERDRLEEMLEQLGLRMMERSLISVDLIASVQDAAPARQRRRQRTLTPVTPTDVAHLASLTDAPLDEDAVQEFVDRVAVIQRQSANTYGFIHLTFQEYCAACALASPKMGASNRVAFIVRRRLSARWEQVTRLLVSELDRQHRELREQETSEADSLLQALARADKNYVKGLRGRDPLHLALARASACERERARKGSSAGARLERRWYHIWRSQRTVRRYWENVPQRLRVNVYTFALIAALVLGCGLAAVWAGTLVSHVIGGVLAGWVGTGVGILAFVAVYFGVAGLLLGVGKLLPNVAYTAFPMIEERSAQELTVRSRHVRQLLARRPNSSQFVTMAYWIGGGALALLALIGAVFGIAQSIFSGSPFARWIAAWMPAGVLLFIVAMLVAWAIVVQAERVENAARAVDNLVEQQGEDEAALLVDLLEDGPYRDPAQRALERLGPAAASMVPRLHAIAAESRVSGARAAAISALGHFGDAAGPTIPTILTGVEDVSKEVRYAAVLALSRLGRTQELAASALEAVLRELTTDLKSDGFETRWQARYILINLGASAEPAVADLERLLQSPRVLIRNYAQQVLAAIQPTTGASSGAEHTTVERATGGDLQAQLASLQAQLKATDESQRIAAAKALMVIGAPAGETFPALRRMARRDQSANARQAATQAIAGVASGASVRHMLIKGMHDRDAAVRTTAAEIWGRLGFPPERARPRVLATARDRHGRMGWGALRALNGLVVCSALLLLILDQLVVNRSAVAVVEKFTFLPEVGTRGVMWLVTTLKSYSDVPSFLVFVTIFVVLSIVLWINLSSYAHWRHAVRDSAMRALPIFLLSIEDAG
jgi:hypothetical protein